MPTLFTSFIPAYLVIWPATLHWPLSDTVIQMYWLWSCHGLPRPVLASFTTSHKSHGQVQELDFIIHCFPVWVLWKQAPGLTWCGPSSAPCPAVSPTTWGFRISVLLLYIVTESTGNTPTARVTVGKQRSGILRPGYHRTLTISYSFFYLKNIFL